MKSCLVVAVILVCSSKAFCADAKPYEEVYATRLIAQVDKNKNGSFKKAEDERKWKQCHKLDANKDNVLTVTELTKFPIKYLETGGERKLNILYKQTPEEDLYMDLYYPTGKREAKCPVVIYTHGGGWGAGDKQGAANHLYGPLFQALTDKGFCVAAVNYRLFKQGGPYVRECVIDCKDAMRYLSKNSDTLKVNPKRFFVIGGSAGGHLSQMLLLTPPESQPGDPELAGASYTMLAGVSWFGFTNVETDDLFFPERGKKEPKRGTTGRIIPHGYTPDKAKALLREMSPTTYLTKDSPPLLVMHGDQDTAVSVKHATFIQKKAKELHAPVDVVIVKHSGHNWGSRNMPGPMEPSLEEIVKQTVTFFVNHLGDNGDR